MGPAVGGLFGRALSCCDVGAVCGTTAELPELVGEVVPGGWLEGLGVDCWRRCVDGRLGAKRSVALGSL
jgi:hypothetical protein